MNRVMTVFLQGLLAIIPISVSLFAVFWLGSTAEALCGGAIRAALRLIGAEEWYFPGAGVLAGLVVVFLFGMLLQWWVIQRLFSYAESLMERIPLLKTIYGSIKDLLGLFHGQKDADNKQVAVVTLGENQRLLGLVTRSDLSSMPEAVRGVSGNCVAVYVPMSYQIGGFTYFIERDKIEPIEMSVEEAMRFAVTAGVSGNQRKEAGGEG